MTPYAELQTTSNFSFLRGASHPEELVIRAAEQKLSAIAITDRNTLAGVVRAHLAAREKNIQLPQAFFVYLQTTRHTAAYHNSSP